ncbi:MAG: GEVED domain-containing protein [Crocinitomicaceae bacterium]|nr:GEVED domain-containing protein [Crocinitomicaceae bacterium]
MKNFFTLILCAVVSLNILAQEKVLISQAFENLKTISTLTLNAPNLEQIHQEDDAREKNGELYRIGATIATNINPNSSGTWTSYNDGSRTWNLRVKSTGAEALSFLFSDFQLFGETSLTVRNIDGVLVHKLMTSKDNLAHRMQNAALCFGDDLILTIHEPANTQSSEIEIDRVVYNYRATGNPNTQKINESQSCEVNVNCSPVGDSWQDEKDGVARIYIVEGGSAGWCTGSLVNNTAQNCKPYFLTALHCGVSTSASNMNQWRFYFRYESPNCNNPSSAGTLDDHYITGCVRLSDSDDGGGNSGSDFLLLQLGNTNNESTVINALKSSNFSAYWNGWKAASSASQGGAGIHHPAGDIKKISTFNGNTQSTSWGSASGSHWQMSWSSNSNGHGVTEGGSSGSPLFNNSGLIIGTLTGGSSFCTNQTSPDLYGKMSYHWTSNGSANNEKLKPWLDPTNSNLTTLNGSSDPCSAPSAPSTDFSASATSVSPGTTVNFSDITSGVPTAWTWSISPTSGWAYAGGSSASSQNPQVTFNTVGQYTVSLTASNSLGSDSETKSNYIIVEEASAPCEGNGAACDEYIANVTLNTIDNSSDCSSGGYGNYLSTSTTLAQGGSYTVTVVPAVGTNIGSAYTDDEIAVWIDFNDDLDFDDAGEQVGYVLVAAGWSNEFTFTVPNNASTGAVAMRARISYSPDGAIEACGESTYGEVEDYSVNITGGTTGVDSFSEGQVMLYPNPAQSELIIDASKTSSESTLISITDITGKIIYETALNPSKINIVNLIDFASGVYQVRMATSQGFTVKQFVKK